VVLHSRFLTKSLQTPLLFAMSATYPAYITLLNLITVTIFREKKAMTFIFMKFTPWSVFLHFTSKYHHLSFLRKRQSMFSLQVWDQVSHPYRQTGDVTLLYNLIFRCFYIRLEYKRLWIQLQQEFYNFIHWTCFYFETHCMTDARHGSQKNCITHTN